MSKQLFIKNETPAAAVKFNVLLWRGDEKADSLIRSNLALDNIFFLSRPVDVLFWQNLA